MTLMIATLNVKGVATPNKFKKTANLLKSYKDIHIITIQETNISPENLSKTAKKWPKESYWTPFVAILINSKKISPTNIFSTHPRHLVMDFTYNQEEFRLETVYIPP